MSKITTSAVLAVFDENGLRQECFDYFDDAEAIMGTDYQSVLNRNGLYQGRITPDSAEVVIKRTSTKDTVVAQWAISKVECRLPENTCLAATISTAHIDRDTALSWNHGDLPCGVYPISDTGWIFYIPGRNEIDDIRPLPKCCEDIIAWAMDNNIGIVLLDSDAKEVPFLAQYDWVD